MRDNDGTNGYDMWPECRDQARKVRVEVRDKFCEMCKAFGCGEGSGMPSMTLLPDESRSRGGFIPAETLVQNGTAGDNDTASGTLNEPVLGYHAKKPARFTYTNPCVMLTL